MKAPTLRTNFFVNCGCSCKVHNSRISFYLNNARHRSSCTTINLWTVKFVHRAVLPAETVDASVGTPPAAPLETRQPQDTAGESCSKRPGTISAWRWSSSRRRLSDRRGANARRRSAGPRSRCCRGGAGWRRSPSLWGELHSELTFCVHFWQT